MNKYLFIFTLILIKIGLSIPHLSYAIIGTGIFDLSKKMFQAIDNHFGFYIAVLGSVLIVFTIITILLLIISSLLDWVILNQTDWINFTEPLVTTGYAFTSALANMLLILILLVIAFAMILKIENFEVKKVLPRLIIVALLLNFSLVFMGVIIDISHIVFNTFLGGETNLVSQVINDFWIENLRIVGSLIAQFILTKTASFMIVVGPASQFMVLGAMMYTFLPSFFGWIIQIFVGIILILTLFPLLILFVIRVFVIQLLAVLAPLAFLCLILPKTKEYWDKWLKSFLEWTFLGVIVFFLLAIGLRAFYHIMPDTNEGNIIGEYFSGFIGWGEINDMIARYFVLAIYLLIVLAISKQTAPMSANVVIDQMKSFGKMALAGASLVGGSLTKHVAGIATKSKDDLEKDDAKRIGMNPEAIIQAEERGELLTEEGRERRRWTRNNIDKLFHLAGTTVDEKRHKLDTEELDRIAKMPVEDGLKVLRRTTPITMSEEDREERELALYSKLVEEDKFKYLDKNEQERAKELQERAYQRGISRHQEYANNISKGTGEMSFQGYLNKILPGEKSPEEIEKIKKDLENTEKSLIKIIGHENYEKEIDMMSKHQIQKLDINDPKYDEKIKEIKKNQKLNLLASIKNISNESPEYFKKVNKNTFIIRAGIANNPNPECIKSLFKNANSKVFEGIVNDSGGIYDHLQNPEFDNLRLIRMAKENRAFQEMINYSPPPKSPSRPEGLPPGAQWDEKKKLWHDSSSGKQYSPAGIEFIK